MGRKKRRRLVACQGAEVRPRLLHLRPGKTGAMGEGTLVQRTKLQLVFEIFVHKFEISLAAVHPVGQHSEHVSSEKDRGG